jgi:hypothetical protein
VQDPDLLHHQIQDMLVVLSTATAAVATVAAIAAVAVG